MSAPSRAWRRDALKQPKTATWKRSNALKRKWKPYTKPTKIFGTGFEDTDMDTIQTAIQQIAALQTANFGGDLHLMFTHYARLCYETSFSEGVSYQAIAFRVIFRKS